MIKKHIYLFLSLAVILIGCDRDPSRSLKNGFVTDLNNYLTERQIAYYCLVNNKELDTTATPPKCKDTDFPKDFDDAAAAKKIRNDFIERTTLVVDANYAEFINALAQGRSKGNFIADLIELSTSAVIGVVDNVNTLQVLGVSLTAFRGARSSFDINFYQQQTTPILINTMDDTRNRLYKRILIKKKWDIERYSLNQAMKDVVDYYNAGTLVRAFTELSKKAAIASDESEQQVLLVQGIVPSTLLPEDEREKLAKVMRIIANLEKDIDSSDTKKQTEATKVVKKVFEILKKDDAFLELLQTEKIAPTYFDTLNGKQLIQELDNIKVTVEERSKSLDFTPEGRSKYETLAGIIDDAIIAANKSRD